MSNLRSAPDIVEIISRYLDMRQAGREHKALCPFHNDRHPSLSVSREKGVFHCWSCGAKGDVYDFIMKHERIGFKEAKARLGVADDSYRRPKLTAAPKSRGTGGAVDGRSAPQDQRVTRRNSRADRALRRARR
jgi:DNA primase